jgi:hypothetical protein
MGAWWICPWDNQVCIDDASIKGIDCSSIPANVYLIWWNGEDGEILYNDRPGIREPFTDVSPYIPLFNQWMLKAQTATKPISLAQARQVKSKLTDGLFSDKRQKPITYMGQSFEGGDEATSAISAKVSAQAGPNVNALKTSLQTLSDNLNASVGSLNSQVSDYADQYMAQTNSGLTSPVTAHGDAINAIIDGASAGHVGGGSNPLLLKANMPAVPMPPVNIPGVTWRTASGAPMNLSFDEFTGLANELSARRMALKDTQTSHKNNVNSLGTVAAVAAYDITSGW